MFKPVFTLTAKIINDLLRVERVKEKVLYVPLTVSVLTSLRETARLYTTHYSTMIEGNKLDVNQITQVIKKNGHFPGRERDEHEVRGYYAALTKVEQWIAAGIVLSEKNIQMMHALVMAAGSEKVIPTQYRDGQNVIKDGISRAIVYLPPEAHDVSELMTNLVEWIIKGNNLPCPVIAAIAHYQFATIHPYYDGNGRTARLLTNYILHAGGYDLKGLFSLEEYYARNLGAYYDALQVGPSHSYYLGRAEAAITAWVEYCIEGMAVAFENVLKRMEEAQNLGLRDQSPLLKKLDPRQRQILALFQEHEFITSQQVSALFGFKPRTGAALCEVWVEKGFLIIADPSNKGRKYCLSQEYQVLVA